MRLRLPRRDADSLRPPQGDELRRLPGDQLPALGRLRRGVVPRRVHVGRRRGRVRAVAGDAAGARRLQPGRRSVVASGLVPSMIRRRLRLRARRRAPPLTPPWAASEQPLRGLQSQRSPAAAVARAARALSCQGCCIRRAAGAATRRRAARRMRSSSSVQSTCARAPSPCSSRPAVRRSSRRHRQSPHYPRDGRRQSTRIRGTPTSTTTSRASPGGSGRSTKLFLRSSAHLPSGPHHRRILAAGSASLGGGEDVEAREAHPGDTAATAMP